MEPLSNLLYLLEPAAILLIVTACSVVFLAAQRSYLHNRESERHKDLQEQSITLDSRQALLIPVASSCSLLIMFYLFSRVSGIITGIISIAAGSSLVFCLSPIASQIAAKSNVIDQTAFRCWCGSLSRSQTVLSLLSTVVVALWLITGHWILNNTLGIAICIAFISHVKLPNVKICALLLSCLFFYDIFWVFFSERFFGSNVMVVVATQQAQNPVHTVADSLNIPVSAAITKKLDLPVKLVFPRELFEGGGSGEAQPDYMMLGLGDMAIPGMLMALILSFDKWNEREESKASGPQHRYFRQASVGYAVGLVTALAAGVLTRSAQPALLYLVPSTLGPVLFSAWLRKEFGQLWNGPVDQLEKDKERLLEAV